ncbi:hypothetical protein EHS25_007224 [Saitozyma podzolica]|uniref:Xylanolytic transcriptional activator regulatory domain-containing protein n=1 Tax=Saitozyma podzolica TaxID=1890683 RepID=A0A427XN91_9TREE|nr:hypothetical protein EHS25_007224 [Saitozyma podzolica]
MRQLPLEAKRTGKACTFLKERRRRTAENPLDPTAAMGSQTTMRTQTFTSPVQSGNVARPERSVPMEAYTSPFQSQRGPSQNVDFFAMGCGGNVPAQGINFSPIQSFPPSTQLGTGDMALSTSRRTLDMVNDVWRARHSAPSRRANPVASPPDTLDAPALDHEAADDEDLYLLGTASERDALVLNVMAGEDEDQSNSPMRQNRATAFPGLRIHRVSPSVSFVFHKSHPYGPEILDESAAWVKLERLVGPHLADSILQKFFQVEGHGLPLWSEAQHRRATPIPLALRCFCLTAGLIYTSSLRHLHREAYLITVNHLRQQSPRGRLWTMQLYLLDLDGREAINPSGNFVVLGLAVSIARLLGLNEDCSQWSIPAWERDLRTRLWWGLLVYDTFSNAADGKLSPAPGQATHYVRLAGRVHLPLRAGNDLERSTTRRDIRPPMRVSRPRGRSLERLAAIGFFFDEWKTGVDARGLFTTCDAGSDGPPPGVRSLNLIYLGSVLMVVRETWNHAGTDDPAVQIACQKACLKACEDIVDFVCGLGHDDLRGYWSSHSPFILSFCLTLLIRLVMGSDRTDQSNEAIWQAAMLISTITGYLNDMQWDVAELTLSRARYFIPLLARQAPEFQVALLPLQNSFVDLADDRSLEEFLNAFIDPSDLDSLCVLVRDDANQADRAEQCH